MKTSTLNKKMEQGFYSLQCCFVHLIIKYECYLLILLIRRVTVEPSDFYYDVLDFIVY